ncbi:MAG: hypothetical protein JOY64_20570 [Alphaproteobacteria bacterium]|nr:hypothetical protein [Alphaproteobacteria bacterium]
MAAHTAIGHQVGATLQQLAQQCVQGVMAGQQFAQLLSQLAQQCAWQAQAARGAMQTYGQPYGLGMTNPIGLGQLGGLQGAQGWGFNRPTW